jgi:outer membrane receptor protein involved in Fe transport
MTAQVGYVYLNARVRGLRCCQIVFGPNGYVLEPLPVAQSTSRGSAEYALNFERTSQRYVVDLTASRAIQPSGLGALLTQDDVSLKASMAWTARWTLGATLHGARIADSLQQVDLGNRRYANVDLSARWRWTEHWTLQLQGSYYWQRLSYGGPTGAGTTVDLNLFRQFARIRL